MREKDSFESKEKETLLCFHLCLHPFTTLLRPNSHRTRDASRRTCKLERFSFDVACKQSVVIVMVAVSVSVAVVIVVVAVAVAVAVVIVMVSVSVAVAVVIVMVAGALHPLTDANGGCGGNSGDRVSSGCKQGGNGSQHLSYMRTWFVRSTE